MNAPGGPSARPSARVGLSSGDPWRAGL